MPHDVTLTIDSSKGKNVVATACICSGDSVSSPIKTQAAGLPSDAPVVNALLLLYLYLFIFLLNVLTLQRYTLLLVWPNIWDILCKQSDHRSSAAQLCDE